MKSLLAACLVLICASDASAQFTRQDSLRGSNGRGRDWWDVLKYELQFSIDTATRRISGTNTITFRIIGTPKDSMQIDLQEGMQLGSFIDPQTGEPRSYSREGNVYWIPSEKGRWQKGGIQKISLKFSGKPRIAINPPWDGGLIWTKDSSGKPWMAVACQGLGASSWWPCKDYQGDEPDSGMVIQFTMERQNVTAENLEPMSSIVLNGRLNPVITTLPESREYSDEKTGKKYRGDSYPYNQTIIAGGIVRNPINTYNTTFYIGDYAHWRDTLHGEGGVLDLDFYPLKINEAKARSHWAVTKDMLRCFEHWMGPYPFYQDGYKLVDAPYLGMEHQSAVAYGNDYKMGYRGHDRSGTGVGLLFDFIIVHESGHEWFGNNITATDVADNWLHEGFTTYTEALFAEWVSSRDSAFAYTTGKWRNIVNDRPVVGAYGVHDDGSGDKYEKGAAVVHMIRLMLHDDEAFRRLLRGLNKDFRHKTVTSAEVEAYIARAVGRDLKPFFDQYLRKPKPPVVRATQHWKKLSLVIEGADPALKIPVYDPRGRFICELSDRPAQIALQDLPALRNYLLDYRPEGGAAPLVR